MRVATGEGIKSGVGAAVNDQRFPDHIEASVGAHTGKL